MATSILSVTHNQISTASKNLFISKRTISTCSSFPIEIEKNDIENEEIQDKELVKINEIKEISTSSTFFLTKVKENISRNSSENGVFNLFQKIEKNNFNHLKNNDIKCYSENDCHYYRIIAEKYEEENKNFYNLENFDFSNKVIENGRKKMGLWMQEVFSFFKNTSRLQTLLRAIEIFDSFLDINQQIDKNEFHLAGMCSIFIASKFEDVCAINLEEIYNDAGHKKFSKQEIISYEFDLLSQINFKIGFSTKLDYLNYFLLKFLLSRNIADLKYTTFAKIKKKSYNILRYLAMERRTRICSDRIVAVIAIVLSIQNIYNIIKKNADDNNNYLDIINKEKCFLVKL